MKKTGKYNMRGIAVLFTFILCLLANSKTVLSIDTVINVAFDVNLSPYQYMENGQAKGLHVDILNRIAEERNLIINYIPQKNLTECYASLDRSEVDIVLGSFVKNRQPKGVSFTQEISQSNICMIAPSEDAIRINRDITTKHYLVSIQEGTANPEYSRRMQNIEYHVMSNQNRVFEALKENKVELAIGVKNSLLAWIKKEGLEDDYTIINNFMGHIKYNMAVKEEDAELLYKLNQSINDMKVNGEYENIYDKFYI